MALADRLKKYREIEQLRERPLFAYVTSARQNAGGRMASDALPEIIDQVLLLPRDADGVDLLIVSNGGDATVAWTIMSLLREKVKTIGVLVPQSAFSAATFLALGADEIIMHPCGNLGPVDPQIPAIPAQGQPRGSSFSLEDLPGFLCFVRERLGLSEHEHLKSAFELFCKEAGAMQIAMGTRAAQFSLSLGEKLLGMHMRDAEGQKKAAAIAETLNTKFFYHGYPVGRREAKAIGLKVIDPGERLETLMWEVWLDFEEEMKCRTPFNLMEEVAKSAAASQVLANIPQVTIPSGLPPDQVQQIAKQIVQQISLVSLAPIDYELRSGMIESCRKASAFVTNGKILARREADLRITLTNVILSWQWRVQDLPKD
jgi:hypothetical protein